MAYYCKKCGKCLIPTGLSLISSRRSYRQASVLRCTNCWINYKNPHYEKELLWKQDSDLKKTKKGRYYKLAQAKGNSGHTLILFHNYRWYAPTEREIFDTEDDELIN